MGILFLIIFGALVGFIASHLMGQGSGLMWDIILGIVGSVVGGFIMNAFGHSGITGFNLYSIVVGVVGAVIVIYIGRMLHKSA
jgi:uncharacterized membrane protein YeaQ/YmgE (transglycosylase-associated protein family)